QIQPSVFRQAHVDNDNLRFDFRDLGKGSSIFSSLANHSESSVSLNDLLEAMAKNRMVLHDIDRRLKRLGCHFSTLFRGTVRVILVPAPGGERIWSCPPNTLARSAMFNMPRPSFPPPFRSVECVLNPRPLS